MRKVLLVTILWIEMAAISRGQQITRSTLIGIWDAVSKNPAGRIEVQFSDSIFTLSVGSQSGQSLYNIDTLNAPVVLQTFDASNKPGLQYVIKMRGPDTLIFVSIIGVDINTASRFVAPTLVRRKPGQNPPASEKPLLPFFSSYTMNAEASWSPDGQEIVFSSRRDGNSEIYLMKKDGSQVRRLTNTFASENSPSFSPNGNKILFVSLRDGIEQIYTMDKDGSNQTNLSNNNAANYKPVWSPKGDKIAYFSNRDRTSQVFVMNADGSHQLRVTNDLSANNSFPKWMPDNNTLICSTILSIPGKEYSPGAYKSSIIDLAENSNEYLLLPEEASNTVTDFSPDGNRILFISTYGSVSGIQMWDIMAYDLKTRVSTSLKKNVGRVTDASFIDDNLILVVSSTDLEVLDSKRKKIYRIFPQPVMAKYSAAENAILFVHVDKQANIYTILPDGEHVNKLTNN